jgi:NitT/TauT family transport system substrate-binding protein
LIANAPWTAGAARRPAVLFLAVVTLAFAACSTTASPSSGSSAAGGGAQTTLRLGYFPNITHAPAIVGIESGIFARDLGSNVKLEPSTFNAGSAASEAILSNAIDATFIGPNPAINAYAKSNGEAIRIIAGTTSGGAALVVRNGINSAADLKGKKLATPQLGNTQDVALRTWLLDNGLETDTNGGGDVSVLPQDNAQTLQAFQSGTIDGAWEPEPWATRLVLEGNGHVLVNESDLWPQGKFVTTQLIVRTDYLKAHPDAVAGLLKGLIEATKLVNDDPTQAQTLANQGIQKITGKPLAANVIQAAWKNLTFTVDPVAQSLQTSADHAIKIGLLKSVDLRGIYDLTALNGLLRAAGLPEVAGL